MRDNVAVYTEGSGAVNELSIGDIENKPRQIGVWGRAISMDSRAVSLGLQFSAGIVTHLLEQCQSAISLDWFAPAPPSELSSAAQSSDAVAGQRQRNEAALHLLEEWLADDSGYDEQVWDMVKDTIETHRLSYRRRFDD